MSAYRDWWWAGGLAGLALGFRPDLVLALALALVFAVWRRRVQLWCLLAGLCVGLLPLLWHLVDAGPRTAFEGMVLDPVVRLRPGRELPRPPSWGIIDGALQAVAEGLPPTWPLPAMAANHQLFIWFFAVIVIAVGGAARRRGGCVGATSAVAARGRDRVADRRAVRARHPAAGAPAT